MFEISQENFSNKEDMYKHIHLSAKGLLDGETDFIANLANISALLYHTMNDINWAGFYLLKEGELVLGPFNGKPACIRIPLGKGVCGTAADKKETVVVKNVHKFPGHIACDSKTQSEIVVPMIKNGRLIGVLDIDSVVLENFALEDQKQLEILVSYLLEACSI